MLRGRELEKLLWRMWIISTATWRSCYCCCCPCWRGQRWRSHIISCRRLVRRLAFRFLTQHPKAGSLSSCAAGLIEKGEGRAVLFRAVSAEAGCGAPQVREGEPRRRQRASSERERRERHDAPVKGAETGGNTAIQRHVCRYAFINYTELVVIMSPTPLHCYTKC